MYAPPEFFLFFSTRKYKASDPFSRFVYVTVAHEGPPATLSIESAPGKFTLSGMPAGSSGFYTTHEFVGQFMGVDGQIHVRSVRRLRSSIPSMPIVAKNQNGNVIPIYEMDKHTDIFGSYPMLRRNVKIVAPPDGMLLDVSGNLFAVASTGPPPSPTMSGTIVHVQENVVTTTKLKKKSGPSLPPVGDIKPHVARQLLELAQLKKEQCPITVEEYIVGETAVMPCGHLFMRMAIEESFKKEPRTCPTCRQHGYPTFV